MVSCKFVGINMLEEVLNKMKTGKKFLIHNCSLCGYPCGYIFKKFIEKPDKLLVYDSGCYCTNQYPNYQLASKSDIEDHLLNNSHINFLEDKNFLED